MGELGGGKKEGPSKKRALKSLEGQGRGLQRGEVVRAVVVPVLCYPCPLPRGFNTTKRSGVYEVRSDRGKR